MLPEVQPKFTFRVELQLQPREWILHSGLIPRPLRYSEPECGHGCVGLIGALSMCVRLASGNPGKIVIVHCGEELEVFFHVEMGVLANLIL